MSPKKKTKITQIKTFTFPFNGKDKKDYSDEVINRWCIDNKVLVESADVVWDIQETFVFVSIQYTVLR